jgi:hypothetical protein
VLGLVLISGWIFMALLAVGLCRAAAFADAQSRVAGGDKPFLGTLPRFIPLVVPDDAEHRLGATRPHVRSALPGGPSQRRR